IISVVFITALSLSIGAAFAQTGSTLTGSYNGAGTLYCDSSDTVTGPDSVSGSLNATTQPSLSSLTASGGQFTGTITGTGSVIISCPGTGSSVGQTITGTISGTVSPGGAVSWGFQMNLSYSTGVTATHSASGGTGNTSLLTYTG